MDFRKHLRKNIKDFIASADLVYEKKDYTSSAILYFKALFSVFDYILLVSGKGVPKDHSERFQKLKNSFIRFYVLLEKLYPIYRNTYALSVEKPKCDAVRDNVRKLVKEFQIDK